jgi:hypothetical protein
MVKNQAAPAVKREAEKDWRQKRRARGRDERGPEPIRSRAAVMVDRSEHFQTTGVSRECGDDVI